MSESPALPFHFHWRYGLETDSLATALGTLENEAATASWHLSEGHLQKALQDQGYGVLAEGLEGDDQVTILAERIRIALELHRSWWAEQDEDSLEDSLSEALGNLGRVFRSKGAALVERSGKGLASFRNWLADTISSKASAASDS
jgi:hypothetical protein